MPKCACTHPTASTRWSSAPPLRWVVRGPTSLPSLRGSPTRGALTYLLPTHRLGTGYSMVAKRWTLVLQSWPCQFLAVGLFLSLRF